LFAIETQRERSFKRKAGEYRDVPVPTWLWARVQDLPDGPLMPGNGERAFQLYGTVYERFVNAARNAGIPAGFTDDRPMCVRPCCGW
jgi:hypothetical protein